MPAALRMELTANLISPKKPQSSAEIFRDMAAIAPTLATADTTIMRPVLGRQPTVTEWLQSERKGDKKMVEETFANTLSVCAAVKSSLDKYRTVLGTPIRDEMARFCNSSMGMEVFSIHMAYEMPLSRCYQFWGEWLKGVNDFMSSLVPDIRHFDHKLWTSLRAIQPRTVDNVGNLFFPAKGGTPTSSTPFLDTGRSPDFLLDLTDAEYREVHSRAISPAALQFNLMSKAEFQNFTKQQIPAFRSVVEQVLRWIVASPKQGKRYAAKPDVAEVLKEDFFARKRSDDPASCARNLVRMIGKCVFDDVRNFAPKLRPSYDNHPTVIAKDPTTDKEREIQETEYLRRFKSNWAWFPVAKMVARFTHFSLTTTTRGLLLVVRRKSLVGELDTLLHRSVGGCLHQR